MQRSIYNHFVRNIITPDLEKQPKRFWSFVKSKKCDNNGIAEDGSDPASKADILNKQFTSVFT